MKKKVAVIGIKGFPAVGGAAAVAEKLIDHLHQKYDFTFYTLSTHTKADMKTDRFRQYIIGSFPFKKLRVFYYYLASAFHAIFFGNYDLVHLHHIDGAFVILILHFRYKVISTSHGKPQTLGKWGPLAKTYFILNEKIFLKYSDVATSVSAELAKSYEEESKRKIHYIPNGMDVKENHEHVPEIEEGNYILFAAARIIFEKGCHIFLEALNKIEYKGKVIIIGDVDQMPEYRKKLMELSAELKVRFTGLIKRKSLLLAYLKNAEFFVFPSLQEAMSMMLLEAASVKTPLICSDLPANRTVFNEDDVLFFKTGDVDDLAAQLLFAFGHREMMHKLSNHAYLTLINSFQWKDIAAAYDELYQHLMTHNP